MESVVLNIKNMVCPRCIFAVENIMAELGIQVKSIILGHAIVLLPSKVNIEMIKSKLNRLGFELIREKNDLYIEKIKVLIIEYLKLLEESNEIHVLSDFITKKIGKNYNYLTKIFSQQCNMTIEQYYINQRLQRVKELLDQDELNVTEISYKLCYSSVNYLSTQFKKYIGVSISKYKSDRDQLRSIYKNISLSINDLKKQGIQMNFVKRENKYYCDDIGEYFSAESVNEIVKFTYNYGKDDAKKAKVSVIETGTNLRGVFVEIPEDFINYQKEII